MEIIKDPNVDNKWLWYICNATSKPKLQEKFQKLQRGQKYSKKQRPEAPIDKLYPRETTEKCIHEITAYAYLNNLHNNISWLQNVHKEFPHYPTTM